MCGLAAIIAYANVTPEHRSILRKTLQFIAHRGEFSFQQEVHEGEFFIAGANRLAITSGTERQPAISPSGRYIVFLNGEIYSHHGTKGSDTAKLALDIEKNGLKVLRSMDGIYAVMVIDTRANTLTVARDRFGVKPLYYAETKHGLLFASEIKALAPHDFVTEIQEVMPNILDTISLLKRSRPEFVTRPLREQAPPKQAQSLGEFANEVRGALLQSIWDQTRDGHTYGIYLSGGIDSSSIYVACKKFGVPVVPLVLGNSSSSDVMHAIKLCRRFGEEAIVLPSPPEEELFRTLHTIIYHCESFEPNVVRASALTWLLAQTAAAQGLRVVLCGEGADELFGGYPEFAADTGAFEATRARFADDLHRTQLQRLDRINMAATIEVRVPFLSERMARVAYSQNCPSMFLARNDNGTVDTKLPLRIGMRELLPDYIAKRPKVVMNEGAGYGSNSATTGMFSTNFSALPSGHSKFAAQHVAWSIVTREEVEYFDAYQRLGYNKLLGAQRRSFTNRAASIFSPASPTSTAH